MREQRVAAFEEIAKEERVRYCHIREDTKRVCVKVKKNKKNFYLVMIYTQEIL